jgi:hypothetical protein
VTLSCFLLSQSILVFPVRPAYAKETLELPPPGERVDLSPEFIPPTLKGIRVYPDDPFRFDFILNKGDSVDTDSRLRTESVRLIKYFLTSLTVPEKDLWVNLSPYEKGQIVPKEFGQTEMGKDLLAEDYLLKQVTASALYPEGAIGKKFWDRVRAKVKQKFGDEDLPVDTFNKVWVMPDEATVYENTKAGTAYVIKSHLKVMLESDYLSKEKNQGTAAAAQTNEVQELAKQVLREVVIPEIEKEVNEGKNFLKLRQVYQSSILAAWFKRKIKKSLLGKVYVDRKKIAGVNVDDPYVSEKIWSQYVEAFKKGVYNYTKDEVDTATDEIVTREYVSGGAVLSFTGTAGTENILKVVTDDASKPSDSSDGHDFAMTARLTPPSGSVGSSIELSRQSADQSMAATAVSRAIERLH